MPTGKPHTRLNLCPRPSPPRFPRLYLAPQSNHTFLPIRMPSLPPCPPCTTFSGSYGPLESVSTSVVVANKPVVYHRTSPGFTPSASTLHALPSEVACHGNSHSPPPLPPPSRWLVFRAMCLAGERTVRRPGSLHRLHGGRIRPPRVEPAGLRLPHGALPSRDGFLLPRGLWDLRLAGHVQPPRLGAPPWGRRTGQS